MSVKNEPSIEAYIGATGSGKGVSLKRRLKALKGGRLLIWDPRNEYSDFAPAVDSLRALVQAFHQRAGPVKARYVANDHQPLAEQFDFVCRLAFAAGNLVFLAEELTDVTKPSWAPPAWRKIITQGRHQGLVVLGAAQRPALIDKSFLGGCTYIRCFTLRYDDDRRAMAKALDVSQDRVDALRTIKDDRGTVIGYLERDFRHDDEAKPGNIRLKAST
ncbi:hypothetical protein CDN99_25565 [Roseateles aquatilis]|uniref:Helicase HerA central domain-containing protein n=1 Tax=Roseateles aquatilis TaxID=431061 RepID=A0A246IUZ4_9BURK|nr:hypothetical protein [Roseateles aquatilis]OWQ83837.1 hypothetical protein CDN99_25565 [Roseateles aquatilis]